MTETQKGILTLIKSAVTGESGNLSPDFSLSEAWEKVKRHSITGMLYEGAALCGVSVKEGVMPRLFQYYCQAIMTSERQLQLLKKLFAAFEAEGIDYMPLKGVPMKGLYPKPELRAMGDADVLIRLEQYDRIRPILETQGYGEQVESDHELAWKQKGLYLELHKRLIPSYNPDLCAYFEDGWAMAQPENGHCWAMRPEDQWLYVFTHMTKHYRDGGIGLRHFTDLYVFRRAYPTLDEVYIRNALERLGLAEFYGHVNRLLTYWFEDGTGDELLDMMTDFVFGSGSFGTADCHTVSQTLRNLENSRMGNGRLLYIWQTAFPGKKTLLVQYPWLSRYPWLRPVAWALRAVTKVFATPGSLRRKQKDLQTITADKIENRRRSLRLVGLDFRF